MIDGKLSGSQLLAQNAGALDLLAADCDTEIVWDLLLVTSQPAAGATFRVTYASRKFGGTSHTFVTPPAPIRVNGCRVYVEGIGGAAGAAQLTAHAAPLVEGGGRKPAEWSPIEELRP